MKTDLNELLNPGRPDAATRSPQDTYDQFSDVSTTPIWDVIVGLFTVALVLGGGLAAIYAAGYFMTGRPSLAWPSVGTVAVLVVVNIALRAARASAGRRVR
jgi:hypothetical protein